ncbi:MAG: nuclear transport factor 2 family protein [Bacteroidota bacterium]
MKTIFLFLPLVFLLSCRSSSPFQASKSDIRFLHTLKEYEWPKAYREQDTLLLDRILGEDFQLVDANGLWTTKQDEISWIKSHAITPDSFYYEIKRLDFLENGTVILAGTGHSFQDSVETVYQSSNVLIKRDGVWKAVLSHVSGVTDQE